MANQRNVISLARQTWHGKSASANIGSISMALAAAATVAAASGSLAAAKKMMKSNLIEENGVNGVK
jgi:hypothetical protein